MADRALAHRGTAMTTQRDVEYQRWVASEGPAWEISRADLRAAFNAGSSAHVRLHRGNRRTQRARRVASGKQKPWVRQP